MAQRIRELRNMAGLTQFEVAKQSRLGRTRLSLAECGHVELRPKELQDLERTLLGAIRSRMSHFQGLLSGIEAGSRQQVA